MNNIKNYFIHLKAEICYLLSNKDSKVFDIMKCQCAYKYLQKKYVKNFNFNKYTDELTNEKNNTIWIYWKQGILNAPKIVQFCINRTKKLFESVGYKVIILDINNTFDYIQLPDYILSKYNKKIISEAHFSDLIRLELLSKYGGCWIDSTVYFSEIEKGLPKQFLYDFFVYKTSYKENDYVNSSNWLIVSNKNNPIINATRDILFEYWKKENFVVQYYFFHIIFKMVCDKYTGVWKKVPTYINIYPHLLQKQLNNEYDKFVVDNILENSRIHKLMYKKLNYDDKNNVLTKILNEEIN